MRKFDNFIVLLGKRVLIVLKYLLYVVVWKIAYWGLQILESYPYKWFRFTNKLEAKVEDMILNSRIFHVISFEPTAEELFWGILASITVVLAFLVFQLPKIIVKKSKNREIMSKTIPYLVCGLEAIIISVLYYININKNFTKWIFVDFVLTFVIILCLDIYNFQFSTEKNYGWKKYLIVNILIALSFGTLAVFFLYDFYKIILGIILIKIFSTLFFGF